MAKATDNHTLADEEWTLDDAFRYLKCVLGKPEDQALYELTERLLAGRLRMNANRFVGGVLSGTRTVPATFWRDHLALHVVEGAAEVRPLKALAEGDYQYTLPARAVRLSWPRETRSPKSLIEEEVRRRVAAGERWDSITKFSQTLHEWMKTVSDKPLAPRTIENRLREWGLWPLRPFSS